MWITTDPGTGQKCRQINKYTFEFKERGRQDAKIRLPTYSLQEIEDSIESYGYSLYPNIPGKLYIFDEYDKSAWQVIAECLYEIHF